MQNKIIYTAILRKSKTVLCEFTQFTGNFQQVVLKLLGKLTGEGKIKTFDKAYKFSFLFDTSKIFCIVHNEIIFISLVECDHSTSLIDDVYFSFLCKLKGELLKLYTWDTLNSCCAYSLIEFVRVISAHVLTFNNMKYNEPIRNEVITIPTVDINESSYNETKISLISFHSSKRKSSTGEPSFQSDLKMFNTIVDSKKQTLIERRDFSCDANRNSRGRCSLRVFLIVLGVILLLIIIGLAIYFLLIKNNTIRK